MRLRLVFGICLAFISAAQAWAVDYRVEALNEGPPAGQVSAEVLAKLSPTGLRVIRGTKRTFCDIWLLKQWQLNSGFKPTAEILYPFQPGQLVGVVRYARRAADFRDQRIDRGVYTLRYAHQPVDGSHVGTSPTRDFLLLIRASDDKSLKAMGGDDLVANSAEAAGSTHPCMLCLQGASDKGKAQSIRHFEPSDWWIVGLRGMAKSEGKQQPIPMDLVIVGHANE